MARSEREEQLRAQMAANSAAWHQTEDASKRDALHRRNQELAVQLDTYTNGGSSFDERSGKWTLSESAADGPAQPNGRGSQSYTPTYMQQLNDTLSSYSNRAPFSYESAPAYDSPYGDTLRSLAQQITNREPFQYDVNQDDLWSVYKKQYTREGERAQRDALAAASAMTGGMPSTAAISAAQQASDYYNAKMTDKIPELQQLAYSMYVNEGNQQLANLAALRGLENDAYSQYQTQLGQYNTDRGFAYGQYQDEGNALLNTWNMLREQDATDYSRWADQWARDVQRERDAVSDVRYADETAYQRGLLADETAYNRGRDAIADARYEDETAYNRGVYADERDYSRGVYADETAYNRGRDAIADARYADETAWNRAAYQDETAYSRARDAANDAYRQQALAQDRELALLQLQQKAASGSGSVSGSAVTNLLEAPEFRQLLDAGVTSEEQAYYMLYAATGKATASHEMAKYYMDWLNSDQRALLGDEGSGVSQEGFDRSYNAILGNFARGSERASQGALSTLDRLWPQMTYSQRQTMLRALDSVGLYYIPGTKAAGLWDGFSEDGSSSWILPNTNALSGGDMPAGAPAPSSTTSAYDEEREEEQRRRRSSTIQSTGGPFTVTGSGKR